MSAPGGIVRDKNVVNDPDSQQLRHGLSRVVLVPGVLALLPAYAGLVDPVAEVRAACLDGVRWLVEGGGPVTVVADAQGRRVAEALLVAAGARADTGGGAAGDRADSRGGPAYLVVANGSARRSEKAPGHLDERAFDFDAALDRALRTPDPAALSVVDQELGAELLGGNIPGFRALGGILSDRHEATVGYADDPFGVQYWVMRWACAF